MRLLLAAALLAGGLRAAAQPPASFDRIAAAARQAREANRAADAIRLYRQGVALKPAWADGGWALGTLYYQQDRYPECREALDRLTGLDAKSGPAWTMLGLCDFEVKRYDNALVHLDRGRQLGFGNPRMTAVAEYHLGVLLARSQQFEQSMDVLLSLVRHGARDPDTLQALGIAALRKPLLPGEVPPQERELVYLAGKAVRVAATGTQADARPEFAALERQYGTSPGVHYLYGVFLQMVDDADGALREFRQELEVSPAHVPARVQIALEYLKRGDAATALPFARDAAHLMPDSFAARLVLGRALLEGGRPRDSLVELAAAARLAPESPQPHFALASAYAKLGRKEDAAREQRLFQDLKTPAVSGPTSIRP